MQLDLPGDALEGPPADRHHLHSRRQAGSVANGVGHQELRWPRSGRRPGRDVHRGADVVAFPVQHRAEVGTDADGGELRFGAYGVVDVEAAAHPVARIGKGEHELVADLFDQLAVVAAARFANELGEPLDHSGGGGVAHRLGQRREPGEVDERS